jgi:opacity protein-like surface antigen
MGFLSDGRADEYFFRPIVSSVNPHVIAGASATGLGFCTGLYMGTDEFGFEKEVSIEFERAKWSGVETAPGQQFNVSETMMPIVLNLRANFAPDSRYRKLRMYIGPCIGAASVNAKIKLTGGAQDQYASNSDLDFAWGCTAGFLFHLDPRADIDIGYRVLGTSDTKFTLAGRSFSTGKYTMDGWYVGVGLRF